MIISIIIYIEKFKIAPCAYIVLLVDIVRGNSNYYNSYYFKYTMYNMIFIIL